MSRHFEFLKKAERADELFSPPAKVQAAPLPEKLRELVGHLFPIQNARPSFSTGICCAEENQSASGVIDTLSERLVAHMGGPVLLVEASVRQPSLARRYGVPAQPGLTDLLRAPGRESECIHQSRFEHLWILPAGKDMDRRDGKDLKQGLQGLFEVLSDRFQKLIVEVPAVNSKEAELFPYDQLDALVLVVRHNRTGTRALGRAMRRLVRAKARVVSTILDVGEPRPERFWV